ncbi:YbaB/EbfC family nucleoid-associated protein [Longispora urticae]
MRIPAEPAARPGDVRGELAGRGASSNGLVSVVVTPTDLLRSLTIDPSAMRHHPEDLADSVVEAVRLAAEDLRARMEEEWPTDGRFLL